MLVLLVWLFCSWLLAWFVDCLVGLFAWLFSRFRWAGWTVLYRCLAVTKTPQVSRFIGLLCLVLSVVFSVVLSVLLSRVVLPVVLLYCLAVPVVCGFFVVSCCCCCSGLSFKLPRLRAPALRPHISCPLPRPRR